MGGKESASLKRLIFLPVFPEYYIYAESVLEYFSRDQCLFCFAEQKENQAISSVIALH